MRVAVEKWAAGWDYWSQEMEKKNEKEKEERKEREKHQLKKLIKEVVEEAVEEAVGKMRLGEKEWRAKVEEGRRTERLRLLRAVGDDLP